MNYKTILNKSYRRLRHEFDKLKPLYHKSYAQCGEDMIAGFYLSKIKKGFYVDIGAYHPKQISNTYFFYKKGWRGINVDGSKRSIKLFEKLRPDDININCCVGNTDQVSEVEFYMFKRAELNTFNHKALPEILKYHGQAPVTVEKIPLRSLRSILSENLPPKTKIDLLSIDAEGADEEILVSNDWELFRPALLIVENHCSIYDFLTTVMHQFLLSKNYVLCGYSRHSYIFLDKELK